MDFLSRTPVILQTEAAECGLAALCMISCHFGHELNLIRARQQFSVSLKGSTVADITRMASTIGLCGRAYALDVFEVPRLQLPVMLHWELNHFVVLTQVKRNGYVIHDPAYGKRYVPKAEFEEKFTGVAVEFIPDAEFSPRKEKERPRIRQLIGSINGLPRLVIELFLLSMTLQLAALAVPYVFQLVVDDVLVHMDDQLLAAVCLGLLFLGLFQAGTEAVRQWAIAVVGSRLSYQLISNVMSHLIRLPLSYFEKRHVGDILMRFNSVQALQTALTTTIVAALVDGTIVTLTLAVMLVYSASLGTIVLSFVMIALVIRLSLFSYQRRLQEALISKQAKEQTLTIETVRSVQSIRTAGGEGFRMHRWSAIFSEVINARLKLSRFGIQVDTSELVLESVQHVVIIYLAASMILAGDGALTVGMLFAFLAYKGQFANHATALIDHVVSFKLLDLHLHRLADIMWQDRDVSERRLHGSPPPEGDIEVRKLAFRYSNFDKEVLTDLSFKVRSGEMVAVIGPSGTGKTTLLKLLLGLYWPTTGEITIGGLRLDRHTAPAWRANIGSVLQDDQLISGTVADNIAFQSDSCDMTRVTRAAEIAGIHNEINRLPMAYLSTVGDLGSALSSGQKQRLLIARALYREPKVLIMDEGTANLDEDNEERLAELVATLPITRIIVAHRPALVRRADVVLRLNGNNLIDVTQSWQRDQRMQEPPVGS